MKKKLEKFLELEKRATKGPWRVGNLVSWHGDTGEPFRNVWSGEDDEARKVAEFQSGLCDVNAQFIAQSRTIAPLAVRELLEAVEILEEQSKQLEDCKKALMAYGWGSEKAGSWMHDLQVLINKTKQFTEDFNND